MYSNYLQGSSKNNLTQIIELWTIVEHRLVQKQCKYVHVYVQYV